ncbi:sigma-54-dependent transcriptional regulator [Desulfogranum japonicum]|uniref:sigma-54-dependent transcriptional regulator n=1 Tax=Desulfogranum japonicum TaxID=231447 RepID=UPI000406DEE9|nr:sigma-54 dependent transcriptional regulator [Desulfogranum japonicum]
MTRRDIDSFGKGQEVLVVDDDRFLLSAISQTLLLNAYNPTITTSPVEALQLLRQHDFAVVLADIRMPEMDGMELLKHLLEFDPELPVILITGHGDINLAVEAMKSGAYHFLQKPVDEDVILATLERALERRELLSANKKLQEQLEEKKSFSNRFHGLIGQHPSMQKLFAMIETYAVERDPVLIVGETGTGKELVARAIHTIGQGPDTPYLAVNMGALPAEMIESELFGHEKGAFTGAIQRKVGKFEYAGTGTLFLDEICSMPAHLQSKLLRVLEERSFTRLGGNHAISLDARIIAATNRDLPTEIQKGNFRQDLYFRLNVLPLHLPPLRERKEDIPLLIEHFSREYCVGNTEPPDISPDVILELSNRIWPGNIRELRNVVRRYCVLGMSENESAGQEYIKDAEALSHPETCPTWKEFMTTQEKKYIEDVLQRTNGQVVKAHKRMGISRKSLYEKINKYSIDLEQFRSG